MSIFSFPFFGSCVSFWSSLAHCVSINVRVSFFHRLKENKNISLGYFPFTYNFHSVVLLFLLLPIATWRVFRFCTSCDNCDNLVIPPLGINIFFLFHLENKLVIFNASRFAKPVCVLAYSRFKRKRLIWESLRLFL